MAAASRFAHVRGLGRRPTREDVRELAAPFGEVTWVARFFGRGTASVEFSDADAAAAAVEASPQLPGRALVWKVGSPLRGEQYAIEDETRTDRADAECRRCIDALVKLVIAHDARENAAANRRARRRHKALLKQMARQIAVTHHDICWDFVSRGHCPRGAG